MQVDPKNTTNAVARVDTSQPVVRKSRAESEHVTFDRTEALNADYQEVPESRVEAVSKAKELVERTNYPPPEAIQRIANLLAMHLQES